VFPFAEDVRNGETGKSVKKINAVQHEDRGGSHRRFLADEQRNKCGGIHFNMKIMDPEVNAEAKPFPKSP